MPYSDKYGKVCDAIDTADTGLTIVILDLKVPLVTPGGVPGVLNKPVV